MNGHFQEYHQPSHEVEAMTKKREYTEKELSANVQTSSPSTPKETTVWKSVPVVLSFSPISSSLSSLKLLGRVVDAIEDKNCQLNKNEEDPRIVSMEYQRGNLPWI